jgi:hypothetical protein
LLVGFTNFDCIDDPADQNSTASYVFNVGNGLVTWDFKKQHALSLSLEKSK